MEVDRQLTKEIQILNYIKIQRIILEITLVQVGGDMIFCFHFSWFLSTIYCFILFCIAQNYSNIVMT
jgi:hypothetical protein